MLIDAHAHLNFQSYNDDREEVLKRCQNTKVINIGSQYPTSRLALELANKYPNMYASVGLHPIHVGGQEHDENEIREKIEMTDEEQLKKIRELLKSDANNRIVAVGETGLDYFHIDARKQENKKAKKQTEVFLKHIELAKEFKKPLMLHCRGSKENPEEAYEETLSTISNQLSAIKGGMIHCFSSTVDIAQKFINLGFYVGFTGIITFPNAGELIEVVKSVPLDKILTETDCPYLAPQAVRGQRNEPRYVEYVARKIAEIKRIEYDEVTAAVEENARKLFGVWS